MVAREAPAGQAALEWLLSPLEPTTFFGDSWERCHRVVRRNDPGFYSGLFSMADVDSLIPTTSLDREGPRSTLEVVKLEDGQLATRAIPPTPAGSPDLYAVYKAYGEGYTVIVNGVRSRWKTIATLCRSLEAVLHCPVQANLYLTPRDAQGFGPHFDTHDAFILQLEGSKTWRIYAAWGPLPLESAQQPTSAEAFGAPVDEFVLGAGDLLYIPRGHVHEALTSSVSSLHLTLGLRVIRWAQLLCEAIMLAAEQDVRFREALPVGFLRSDETMAAAHERLGELLGLVPAAVRGEAVIARLGERFLEPGQPVPDGHFVAIDQIRDIHLETRVRRRTGMTCLVSTGGDRAAIQFPGNTVVGPERIEPALRFVAATESFVVKELPWLNDQAKLVLVRRLVREGLLRVESLNPIPMLF